MKFVTIIYHFTSCAGSKNSGNWRCCRNKNRSSFRIYHSKHSLPKTSRYNNLFYISVYQACTVIPVYGAEHDKWMSLWMCTGTPPPTHQNIPHAFSRWQSKTVLQCHFSGKGKFNKNPPEGSYWRTRFKETFSLVGCDVTTLHLRQNPSCNGNILYSS